MVGCDGDAIVLLTALLEVRGTSTDRWNGPAW